MPAHAHPHPKPRQRSHAAAAGTTRPALLLLLLSGLLAPTARGAAPVAATAAEAPAPAPIVQRLRTAQLAATCANCHGSGGQALPSSPVPGLAGLPRADFVSRMTAFQAGQREATVMHQIAKGFSAAQIKLLAAWFAAQPPP